MPWVDAGLCPLGAAALKAYLQQRGVETDVHYFNLRLADRLGLADYTVLSRASALWPEWFFAYHLFGPGGTGELRDRFEDARALASFRAFARETGLSDERLRALLLREIPSFLDECERSVPWRRYGLVGFSSTMYSHAACLVLSRRLKERHGSRIAFGGPNVEGEMGPAVMEGCGWIDYAVDGEGEEALLALARGKAGMAPPPGVTARLASGLKAGRGAHGVEPTVSPDLARLPTPDHDDFFAQLRRLPRLKELRPLVTVETSRGCWWGQKHHCTFCGIPDAALVYRAMPAKAAARRIWAVHERYGASRVYTTDLIMGLEHLRELLPELERLRREHDSDLRLFYETKANLTREQLQAMARAGVTEAQAGIESLSTPALRRMRKGVSALQNAQTLKWGLASGVKVIWNYLHGFPGETAAEHERAAELALALTHLQPPAGCGEVRPDRFSPLQQTPAAVGGRAVAPDPVYERLFPKSRFDLRRLAYGFVFTGKTGAPDARARRAARKLSDIVRFWGEVFPRNFLAARRGPGFVELYDSRPLELGASPRYREERLSGLEAAAYRACESAAGFPTILAACRSGGFKASSRAVRAALARLAGERWLLREDDLYLALAIPVQSLPAPQRVLFEALQAAARQASSRYMGRVPLA